MSSSTYALQTKSLSKSIESAGQQMQILQDINLTVHQGSSAAIVGRSGAGKSTLLSLLAGLDTASEGEVHLFGHEMPNNNETRRAQLRAEYIGFVFQSFQLLPQMTCWENITLPLTLLGRVVDENKIDHWLDQVGLLPRKHAYPGQLSGGEQQRIGLARAFSLEPQLLFADEPTGNLDNDTGEHVADLMFALNKEAGTTLLLVTHDMSLASRCEQQHKIEAHQLVLQS